MIYTPILAACTHAAIFITHKICMISTCVGSVTADDSLVCELFALSAIDAHQHSCALANGERWAQDIQTFLSIEKVRGAFETMIARERANREETVKK